MDSAKSHFPTNSATSDLKEQSDGCSICFYLLTHSPKEKKVQKEMELGLITRGGLGLCIIISLTKWRRSVPQVEVNGTISRPSRESHIQFESLLS